MDAAQQLVRVLAFRRDPRTLSSLALGLPAASLFGYTLLVAFGPRLMKRRATPQLKPVVTVYNIGQILISWYLFREALLSRPSTWLCSPVEVTSDSRSLRLAGVFHLFLFSKMIDLLDTVFMVLRKDHKRMTYFHVYHHSSIMFSSWMAFVFAPGGAAWLPIAINSFVHGLMYMYYLLAGLGPRVRPYLWWKRYLTQLQLVQFGGMACYVLLLQTPGYRCGLPLWTCAMPFTYIVTLLPALAVTVSLQWRAEKTPPAATAPAPAPAEKSSIGDSVRHSLVESFTRHGFGCFVDHSDSQ